MNQYISSFSPEELQRYDRHIRLPEVGLAGQEAFKTAKVLVVGAGGLGCPALQYLAAAGIGTIGIVDYDRVDVSNLQRQILYTAADVGRLKSEVAAERLAAMRPDLKIKVYPFALDEENAVGLFAGYDVVVDGTDNFKARYLINDACVISGKPLVFGAIMKFEGQLAVFNYQNGPTYRCLHPEPPAQEDAPNCNELGVLGVLPGIIGTMQANEVLKVLLRHEGVLSGRLWIWNALTFQSHLLHVTLNPENLKRKYIEPVEFGACPADMESDEISVEQAQMKVGREGVLFLDVREPWERSIKNIPSQHVVLGELLLQSREQLALLLGHKKEVIIFCERGIRSLQALRHLQPLFPEIPIKSLKGGLHEWPV